jgi:hypothetical protein
MYSRVPGDKGGPVFYRQECFSALVLRTNWCTTICITCPILRKIECIKFVYNKCVLVLVQIDLIQFEFSNCIRSICTETNTNLLHTNSIHSISRENWTILRKIGHVVQIVVHQFVHKTSAKKISSEKNQSPFIPRYVGIRRISTKEKKLIPYKSYVRGKHVESILRTRKNMTKKVFNLNNMIPHSARLVDPF